MKKLLIFFGLTALLSASGNGQIILAWDFSGKDGDEETVEATTRNSLISNSEGSAFISRGDGPTASGNDDRFNSNTWSEANNLASAISDKSYLRFDIAPVAGAEMTFTSLTFDMKRSSTGPTSFALLSSIDGFSDLAAIETWTLTGATNNDNTADLVTGLGGKFANLTSNVEFRLYGYNAGGPSGSAGIGIAGDDLFIEGTVIPEPSTYALIFGGIALGFVVWRKRRQAAA